MPSPASRLRAGSIRTALRKTSRERRDSEFGCHENERTARTLGRSHPEPGNRSPHRSPACRRSESLGLDDNTTPVPLGPTAARKQLLEFVAAAETGNEALNEALFAALVDGLEPIAGLDHSTKTITGPAGNDIQLLVTRPANSSDPLPGILYLHGGAMVMLKGSGPIYACIHDELAVKGLVVIGVEFRNGGGVLGPHPFPAGLGDCAAALDWVHAHRATLGISTLTVAGESGGGNLALATALRAKREGRLAAIDGAYALVPYISGLYGAGAKTREAALPSLVENDGYFMGCDTAAIMAEVYVPGVEHATDPLCWPCHVTVEDLSGLPPHALCQ